MVIVGVFQLKSPVLFDSNLVQSIPFHSNSFPSFLSLPFPFSQQRSAADRDFSTKPPRSFPLLQAVEPIEKPKMIHPQPQIKPGLLKFQLPLTASQSPSSAGLAASGESKAPFWLLFFSGGEGENVHNLKANLCFAELR